MKNIEAIITVVSWEERFIKGFELNLNKFRPNHIIFFQFKEYEDRNKLNYEKAKQVCKNLNIAFKEQPLDFMDPRRNWFSIKEQINSGLYTKKEILIDITTMPRETIWVILFFLEHTKSQINYIYYRAKKHNDDWLARDPSDPRLLYKMSGINELGKPTLLFVFPGYDYQRIAYLINYFEPKKLIMAVEDNEKNNTVVEKCLQEFKGNILIETFNFDSFNEVDGYEIVSKKVEENFRNYNIVFSSLGPKVSSLLLYKINRAYPETALCYVPCKEFNEKYSEGIQEENFVLGNLQIPKRKYELVLEY